jgi:hypothetical protein
VSPAEKREADIARQVTALKKMLRPDRAASRYARHESLAQLCFLDMMLALQTEQAPAPSFGAFSSRD